MRPLHVDTKTMQRYHNGRKREHEQGMEGTWAREHYIFQMGQLDFAFQLAERQQKLQSTGV